MPKDSASILLCTHVTPECPVSATTYGYVPNLGANTFFTVFYGILGICQLVLGIYFRTWTFMMALVVGAWMETAGYVGRLLMHQNPWSQSAFKLQIVCLVLAPTFVAAGVYLTLKHTILYLGPRYSRLKPALFTWTFIGCDIGSLCLQAAGGGIAASAGRTDRSLLKIGDDVITTGITFQVVTMSVCGLLGLEFFIRFVKAGAHWEGDGEKAWEARTFLSNHVNWICLAESLAYTTVLCRCIYRVPEMAGGWGNPLMRRENEFLILDGTMISISILALTIFHPGFYFTSIRTGYKKKT